MVKCPAKITHHPSSPFSQRWPCDKVLLMRIPGEGSPPTQNNTSLGKRLLVIPSSRLENWYDAWRHSSHPAALRRATLRMAGQKERRTTMDPSWYTRATTPAWPICSILLIHEISNPHCFSHCHLGCQYSQNCSWLAHILFYLRALILVPKHGRWGPGSDTEWTQRRKENTWDFSPVPPIGICQTNNPFSILYHASQEPAMASTQEGKHSLISWQI